MSIKMAGIDYNKAAIEMREKFALTKTAQAEMLHSIRCRESVLGCVIINTCNRMEVWLSVKEYCDIDAFDILSNCFPLDHNAYNKYFTQREGDDAVRHLFELACGLKSMIFGEEQILSQVKESIGYAGECGASDPILQALFRHAVTAAKKAKTEVRLVSVDRSVAKTAVEFLMKHIGSLQGVPCLVIGSGEMGRLAAKGLEAEGCNVTMTLRQYKSGDAVVPVGCKVIDYESRYSMLPEVQIVISATTSPHHTLQLDKVREMAGSGKKIMVDLAMPRDIEPEIGTLPNIMLYDIDHLGGRLADELNNDNIVRVREIITETIGEFERWRRARALMPKIIEICAGAADDLEGRIQSGLKHMTLDESCLKLIHDTAGKAVSKVVENILLSLNKEEDGVLLMDFLSEKRQNAAVEDLSKIDNLPPRFPLFVDLSGKKIAVIGAGTIALRRVLALTGYPCTIRVTATEARSEIRHLNAQGKITYLQKAYEPSDLDGAYLVVAATDNRELNHQIAQDAGKNGQYCSIADCKEECTFYFPATVHYDGGVIGICGTGENHARTKEMTAEIRQFIKAKEDL